ncbi:MAG: fasciclin domain-containing protein [Fimbriimonadaceae bacterium]|nr:fasciclin domain-containing protein [Fimbriimonadaceae bacterium]
MFTDILDTRIVVLFTSGPPLRNETNMKKSLSLLIATAALAMSATAKAPEQTIVGIAAGNENFSTLVSLVQSAGLVDVLNSDGPFTVFAPTNDAFAKVPEATLKALANDKEALRAVLLYHVVPGKFTAQQVLDANRLQAPTALKRGHDSVTLNIRVLDGKVRVNRATVTATDIMASNGVIHVIDTVLIPPTAR